jgi:PAS domain S-box-containing protein
MDASDASCRFFARLSLLSKVGDLAGTLDYERVLSAVARLSIPELADWCIVDVAPDGGAARRMEVAHRDPARAPLAAALRAFPLDHDARRRLPVARALRSGEPVLIPDYTDEMLRQETHGDYLELALQLRVRSLLVVPVTLGSALAGMAFITTAESGRRYGPEDVALAEELVRRAAQLVENARVHRKLRQTEERFRVALAHSNITLFEQDRDGRYTWIYNPPFGLDPAEVVGMRNEDLMPAEDAGRLAALDRTVLVNGQRVHEAVRLRRRGEGEERDLLVSQEPLRDAAGAIVGLTGAATDITEQKRAQHDLAQALSFRDQVIGILGHDLRNPLGAVRALAALLQRRGDLPDSARAAVAEIDRAGERMLEMIRTLLDFATSRFTGGLPIAPVAADLRAVCRIAVDELRAASPGRRIELDVRGDATGAWDPARVAQVVSNLVANALEHGARNTPVRVRVRGGPDTVVLEVRNDGPVIPGELRAVMFEPFCRGSSRRDASSARGLGLGLFIAREIVRAHGGTIEVESSPQRGTTFRVRLPRRAPAATAPERSWGDGAAAGV